MTDGIVPLGYALRDKDVLLLDEDGNEVGTNQIGEIVVRSRYLSPGYWRQSELTPIARFVPDPQGGDQRLYRTGDLGRRYPDGRVVHVGRADFQVKVGGQRVDLTEIQTTLRRLDAIKEAVVMHRQYASGEPRLVAYLIPACHPTPTVSWLRRCLADSLSPHMIPSAFVWLDAFPCLPSGKLDRLALPAPDRIRPALDSPFIAPRTPVETELACIWAECLELEQVGIHDSFLDLGGHSLLATQILSRVIETLQVDLPLRTLMETPSIAEMAVVITQHQAAQANPETVARLLAEVEAMANDEAKHRPLTGQS